MYSGAKSLLAEGRESRTRGGVGVESDLRYYQRRAAEERAWASRAVTEAARARRLFLADRFQSRVAELHRQFASA